jgi:NAD(P)-dependent dehydrogenase (short-subunit alcohol dehydrogenase family)
MGLLEGKVALIAGVGPGLGRSTALRFAAEGAAVVLGARSAHTLDAVAAEITAAGGRCHRARADLSDHAQAAALAAAAHDTFGRLDILVLNAFDTDADYAPLIDADLERWQASMDVSYWGLLRVTQAALPYLQDCGAGRVVVVGSLSAHRPQPTWGSYVGPKAALVGFVRQLAVEAGPHGVRVNAIQPAHIFGPTVEKYFHDVAEQRGVDYATVYREAAQETALGYLPPSDEIAGSIVFLASDLAAPVTGQVLNVNAGAWLN